MSPRKHDVVETTVRLVDTILGAIDAVPGIRVTSEGVRVYDPIGELAADDEGILQRSASVNFIRRGRIDLLTPTTSH